MNIGTRKVRRRIPSKDQWEVDKTFMKNPGSEDKLEKNPIDWLEKREVIKRRVNELIGLYSTEYKTK